MTVPPLPEPLVVGPLTVTDFVRYQGASGDMNPLHHDPAYARSAGFPTPVSVGMLQAGLLGSWAVDWLGADAVRRLRVRFREPVLAGDTLTCTGTLAAVRGDAGERLADIELTCTRQTGGVAAQGWATFCLERSSS